MTKCIGCGIKLQNISPNVLGYIVNEENELCERCFKLKNYGQYTKVNLENKDYINIINNIPKDNLVLYTTDILNLTVNNIDKFNNLIIVVTKKDILPKSIKDQKIIDYIKRKYPNVLDVIVISTIKNYNLDDLYNKMKKYSNKKPVYIIGNTNSGKSTLINKLIDNYSSIDKKVTTSMYPSTTLDKVEIKLEEITLIDTPGLIDITSIVNYIDTKDIKRITPKKEIKPKSCQINGVGSLIIDKFIRIDYETKTNNSLVIYANNGLDIRFSSLKKEVPNNFVKKEFNLESKQDIIIPGIGFIKFVGPIKVTIYCEDYIVPYSRDNLI